MEQQHSKTRSGSKPALVVLALIAVVATVFAFSMSGKATKLEQELNSAKRENDSLSRLVTDQARLLEAEGKQFQDDLLKIDSLENARR